MRQNGFTLVELLIVLVVISILSASSFVGISKYGTTLLYKQSINQVVSDIRSAQQLSESTHSTYKISFKAGTNEYEISRDNKLEKTIKINKTFQFFGKSYFSFAPSGYTDVGGSGTIFIDGVPNVKKIILSSKGRVRVE